MFTYIVIGLPFMAFACLLDLVILKTGILRRHQTWIIMAVLFAMTALFDQFIARYFVLYTEPHTLGLKLLWAPIEDFTYTFVAVILVGSIITHGRQKGWVS
jgi:lycopene cyclase domain-containing protein